MSPHTFFVNELATLTFLYFHTFILRLSIQPCTFLSLTPKNFEQATFRFSWQLRKIFTGGTPIPYFDQSVAYDKPDGGTVSSVELVQQAENDLHWQKGEILCFMLPKLGFEPEKMINVYGTLAKDVFANCRYGTCVMQDGTFSTFAYSVVWAAKERMRDDKYRSRCPYTRLKQWFTSKSVDATEFAREILASEQRYKETIEGTNSPTSDASTPPPPSEQAPSSERDEQAHVIIPEGQFICLTPTKHSAVFGIVAEIVTDKMSSGRCIMVKALSMDPPKVQNLPMDKLEEGVKRMILNVYKEQCPYGVLNELLAADKRDKSEQSTDMGDAEDSTSHESSSLLFQEGTYVFFNNKKGLPIFGVLMRDVTTDDVSGTCLMANQTFDRFTFQDFSLVVLQRVADRFEKQINSTKERVINNMKELLDDVYQDVNEMEASIQESIEKYLNTLQGETSQPAPPTDCESNITASRNQDESSTKMEDACSGGDDNTDDVLVLEPTLPHRNQRNTPEVIMPTQKQAVAEVKHVSRSTKAVSGDMDSIRGDDDVDSLKYLSHQVEVLTKKVKRMSNARPTLTQAQGTSKRSIPVEDRSRCALLSVKNEIIEIISDDEDNVFMKEPAAPTKTKKPKRVPVLRMRMKLPRGTH